MCVRMLREDAELVRFRPNFTIYDDDDSRRLCAKVVADLDINNKLFPLNMIRSRSVLPENAG